MILKRFCLLSIFLLISSCGLLWAQNADPTEMPPPVEEVKDEPIRFVGDTYSDKHYYDGRLRYAVGVHNYQAMRANRSQPPEATADKVGWTYSHQPYLAYWNGKYHLQYLSNVYSEHIPPGRTLLMTSDDGFHWSPPEVVFPKYSLPQIDRYFETIGDVDLADGTFGVMHQRMGFYVAPNGRLLTSGFYSFSPPPEYTSPNDGQGIGRVVREVYEDGTYGPIYFIRYNRSAGWDESNTRYPFYTESDDEGFIAACDSLLANKLMTLQWQEEDMYDPDFYEFDAGETFSSFMWTQRPDDSYLGVMKDEIASLSKDGVHWTEPGSIPTFNTTRAKIWVQQTEDDRYALVYNHSGTSANRFPMVALTSNDAYEFDNPLLLNGEVPPMRYMGFEKNTGSQYFRGFAPGNGNPPGDYMWNTYSMNKEDIWVSRTPVPIRGTVDEHVSQDFENVDYDVSNLELWNLYVPKWAPVSIDNDPVKQDNKVLKLEDEEPYDYAIAQRTFPESKQQVTVEFDVYVEKVGNAYLLVEVQDKHGARPNALRFDGARVGMDRGGVEPAPLPYPSGKWMHVRMDLDLEKQGYTLYIDGEKIHDLPFDEEVESLERLVFRTGPWRGDVRQFIVDGEPGAKGIYKEDLPGADSKVDGSTYLIDNVKTY
ncbi:hypothetical protein NC796_12330 [Aliifodinibius sp. S!AR15-10]|nr:hypothetical protein [Aliifodinibius sp. S!AR15-10]